MLMALLHSKLSRDQENMEDILTSIVFGTLKYIPSGTALIPFFRKAYIPKAATPAREYPFIDLPSDVDVRHEFWPWIPELGSRGCEPDVLIRMICPDGKKFLVFIEAKYLSGKSSGDDGEELPNDQLAREWANLKSLAMKETAEPVLIYLTADIGCPSGDIQISQKELKEKTGEVGKICWLSWRHLPSLIEHSNYEMLKDLASVLRRLNLTFFEGFSRVDAPARIQWTFSGKFIRFDWSSSQIKEPLKWRFKP